MAYKKLTFEKTETVDIAEKVGLVTEGIYLGARNVSFGDDDVRVIVDMEGPLGSDDKFSFWAPTSVKMNLPQIPVGARLRLTFLGKQKNPNTGRTFKAFDVEVDDGAETPSAAGSGVRV